MEIKMRKDLLDFPKQFSAGLKTAEKAKLTGKFEWIVVCGMGGSALIGDALNAWIRGTKRNILAYTHRDYNLPFWAGKNCLVVCASYSGNTEETLSSYREAVRKKLPVAAITTGGKLAELCQKNKTPLALIPKGVEPRMGIGYQFSALMQILANCKMPNDTKAVSSLGKRINSKKLEKQGKSLAKKIKGTPLIYSSYQNKELGRIFKISFNENAKIHSFSNFFPELNHNEMVGFTKNRPDLQVIMLRDRADHPRNMKRMDLTAKILKKKKVKVEFIELKEKDILLKFFSNVLLSNWITYYLALENKIDPISVKIVEEFKNDLKN